MYVIGLTGGIASGKSTVAETLRTLGAQVVDADAISRRLTLPGGGAAPAILERFGTLDRKTLGHIVFSDPDARADLNAIVHPLVQTKMEAEIAASSAPVVVLDIPLLFEAKMDWMVNEVWVVYAPREEQILRIVARDGLSEAEAVARIDSQMPTEEKIRRADATIDTTGSFAQTRALVESLWRATLARVNADAPIERPAPATIPRRRQHQQVRQQTDQHARVAPQKAAPAPVPQQSTPAPGPVVPAKKDGAWEDTSTLLDLPSQTTFLSRQPPVFWVVSALLLVSLLTVIGIIGVNEWKEIQAERNEAARLRLLAEEKARYRFPYRDQVEAYAVQWEVDPALVAAVIFNESRFDPQAVSRVGARGLMQIMEETGEWIAGRLGELDAYGAEDLFEADTNIRYGVWYLSYLSRIFDGDMVKIAAGYHAGQNRVLGWLENPEYSSDGKTLDAIPYPDTHQYVQRVVDTYAMYIKHYYTPDPTPETVT